MYVVVVHDQRIIRSDAICVTEDERTARVVMENYVAGEVSTETGKMSLNLLCEGDKQGTYGEPKSALEISDELISKNGASCYGAIMQEDGGVWLQFHVENLSLTPKMEETKGEK